MQCFSVILFAETFRQRGEAQNQRAGKKEEAALADFLSLCAQCSLYMNAPGAGVQDGSTS